MEGEASGGVWQAAQPGPDLKGEQQLRGCKSEAGHSEAGMGTRASGHLLQLRRSYLQGPEPASFEASEGAAHTADTRLFPLYM